MQTSSTGALPAVYFDGVHAKGHAVHLYLDATTLHIQGNGIDRTEALRTVQWPERTRHGLRIAHLVDGGSVQCADSAAWDDWSRNAGVGESWIVRLQQSWRGVVACLVLLVVSIVALQQWGVPLAARAVVALTPRTVDAAIGDAAQTWIDQNLMQPSTLAPEQLQHLRDAFAKAVATMPAGSVPHWELALRSSKLGPNAFALPNGTIIVTDDMVKMVDADDSVLVGVLAHELGHLKHRHSVRMLVQVTALGAIASLVVGDFSSLLASVPVLMGQASYSRQAEQEADATAVAVLRSARLSPAVMVTMFEKLEAWRNRKKGGAAAAAAASSDPKEASGTATRSDDPARPQKAKEESSWLGIAFASHPPDAERVRFFREAAR
jgi:Zn-dependent protease with chaperone function